MAVNLPLTGTGQSTAAVATEQIGGNEYQFVKLVSGTAASTVVGSAALLGTVSVSSGQILSTATVIALGIGSSANIIGSVVNAAGSSAVVIGQVAISTANSLTLGAGSSATVIGQVSISTANSLTVSSGLILAAGSSANVIGSVTNAAATTGTLIGAVAVSSGVVLGAGSTANSLGSVALVAGTSANTVGSVALVAGSSANVIGQIAVSTGTLISLNLGTSATYNFMQSIPFSTATIARTSVSTTVDISVIAANANRKALIITNGSTTQTVSLGFSTAAVTTALVAATVFLAAAPGAGSYLSFGLHGGLPLYTGPIRGINISSTTVAGGVFVTEWT